MNDIRLIYIGSPVRAMEYARGNLPEPSPTHTQILCVQEPEHVAGLVLAPWCHIATELHTDRHGTRPALDNAAAIFEAAVSRRPRKAGA